MSAKKKSSVTWETHATDIPAGMYDLARHRMEPFVDFYGNFIRTVTLDQLACSCYLQGCRDMAEVSIREVAPPPTLDFQI